jgi:hypothetical protein
MQRPVRQVSRPLQFSPSSQSALAEQLGAPAAPAAPAAPVGAAEAHVREAMQSPLVAQEVPKKAGNAKMQLQNSCKV